MGVEPVSNGLRAVAGKGSVSAPAAVMATGADGPAGAGGGLAAAARRSLSCLSGYCSIQISIRNFMPKKLMHRNARKAVAISARNTASMNMLTTMKLTHAKPSPMAIIAIA